MATEQKNFSNTELVEALIKYAGIKEGIWMLSVNFGSAATNVLNEADGQAGPAMITTILGVGLIRVNEASALAVDASTCQ